MPFILGVAEPSSLQTAFSSALEVIKTDVLGYVAIALPVGLLIMGTIIGIKIGIKFFKSLSH